MKKKPKTFHESFSKFFEDPTRETFRGLLSENLGEFNSCDFKVIMPSYSKLAKHLLAIGNYGGGCIVLGVQENEDNSLTSVGLENLTDKAKITSGVEKFLPKPLLDQIEIGDFPFKSKDYPDLLGKNFQVIFVKFDPEFIPFISLKGSGQEIRKAAIYIRRGTRSEEANYEELRDLLNRRLAVGSATQAAQDLKEHLKELEILYKEIPKILRGPTPFNALTQLAENMGNVFGGKREPNPNFPGETYQEYIRKLLDRKKILVEKVLGVENLRL